jgi:hypothetical protein
MGKMQKLEEEVARENRFARRVQRVLAERVFGGRELGLRECWKWVKDRVREQVGTGYPDSEQIPL